MDATPEACPIPQVGVLVYVPRPNPHFFCATIPQRSCLEHVDLDALHQRVLVEVLRHEVVKVADVDERQNLKDLSPVSGAQR